MTTQGNSKLSRCLDFIREHVRENDYRLTLDDLVKKFFEPPISVAWLHKLITGSLPKGEWRNWLRLPRYKTYISFSRLLTYCRKQGYKPSTVDIAKLLGITEGIAKCLVAGRLGTRYSQLPTESCQTIQSSKKPIKKSKGQKRKKTKSRRPSIAEKIRRAIWAELTLYGLGIVSTLTCPAELARRFHVTRENACQAIARLPRGIQKQYRTIPKTRSVIKSRESCLQDCIHSLVLRSVRDFWHNRSNVIITIQQLRRDLHLGHHQLGMMTSLSQGLAKEWWKLLSWQAKGVQVQNREMVQLVRREMSEYLRGGRRHLTSAHALSCRYVRPNSTVSKVLRNCLPTSWYRLHTEQCRRHNAKQS